jgi:NHLM bacteriocin system ABC transporter ATP-binding protein
VGSPGNSGRATTRSWTVTVVESADASVVGRRWQIPEGGLTIGRGGCTITVADPSVSRRHAELKVEGAKVLFNDLGSSNGTWVGDRRVTTHAVTGTQRLRLGTMVVQVDPPPPAPAQEKPAPQPTPAPPKAPPPSAPPEAPKAPPATKPAAPEPPPPKSEKPAAANEDAAARVAAVFKTPSAPKPKEAPPAEPPVESPKKTPAQAPAASVFKTPTPPKKAEKPKPKAAEPPAPEPVQEKPAPPPEPLENLDGLSLSEVFEREGVEVKAAGNEPFLIDDSDHVWWVSSGKVELFTVAVEHGAAKGARNHFATISQGDLIVGMDPELFNAGSGFLAVGSINTMLRRISRARLREIAGDGHLGREVARWLDGWISSLSTGLTDEIPKPPVEEMSLIVGERITLPARHQGCPNKGVVWVEVESGRLLFVGMEELTLEDRGGSSKPSDDTGGLKYLLKAARPPGKALFPVATATWVEPLVFGDPGTAVRSHGSADQIAGDALWHGLDAFHEAVCQCEFINKRLSQVDELNRLKSKEEYSNAARRQGLSDLASVMDASIGTVSAPAADAEDAIYEAAVLVGRALHMEVRRHPEGEREKSFDGRLAAIAKASRFRTRQIALRDEWWRRDSGPMVGKLGPEGRPVALMPVGLDRYECVDPMAGTREAVTDDLAGSLDPFGVTFYRAFPDGALTAKELVRFGALGIMGDVRWIVLMGIALGLLGTLTPIFTGKLFDTAIPQADRSLLLQFTTGLFLAAAISSAFTITQRIAVLRIQGRMDYSIQAALWDRLLDLPSTFFRGYSSGDLADRVGGIARIRDLVAGAGVSAILGSLSSVFYVVLLFKYSVPLAFLAMFLTAVFVAFTFTANYLQLRKQRQHLMQQGKITGMVLQFISGVSKLRVAGAENHAFSVWAKEFATQRRLEFGIGRIQNAVAVFSSGFNVISSMAIFFVLYKAREAAGASGPGAMSTGDFVAFTAAYGTFLAAMMALSDASLNLLRILPIYERIRPILEEVSEVDATKAYPGTLKGAIELKNVFFRYSDDGPWILQGVTLKIKPGEMVAFVGGSGSGKSTLLRLMLGFETPDRGVIYYDGQDLSSVDVRELRQQLGVVLQDSKVMPADIFRNIVGASDLTVEHAWEAARMAGFDADIKQLPMGMHTYVSEGGGGFSGGQLQRLLIARALVRKPRILYFDEATSALDNRSQNTVTESMERLFATRIVIAHRLSTIVNADRICYLDKGVIAEQGSYQELMEKDGLFAALAKRQMA